MKFKHMTYLLLLSLIWSCSSKVDDVNDESGNATFEMDQIQVVSSESIASDDQWPDIKDRYVVDLRTCFLDTVYIQSIVGEDFSVESDLSQNNRTTDAQGCINWTEKIDFNYLMDESYIKLKGQIKGEGNYKGLKSYQLAINPWTGKVIDLAHGSANNIIDLESFNKMTFVGSALEVEDFSVEVVEKQFLPDQTRIKMDIITTPQIVRRDLNGAMVKEVLSGGNFKIKYHLIQKSLRDENRMVISSTQTLDSVRQDGRLNSVVDFEINRPLDPNSIIELGVEIQAEDPKLMIGRDSGVMAIKDLDLRFSGKLIDSKMEFGALKSLEDLDDLETDQESSFGFLIEKVNIQGGAEGGSNLVSDNVDRRKNATFNVQILDSLILKGIRNYTFDVQVVEHNKRKGDVVLYDSAVTSMSGSGEMQFTVSIPFKSYDVRRYNEYTLVLKGRKAPYKDIIKTRKLYINPWKSGHEFGIDAKFGEHQKSDTENIPRIFIPNVSYQFIGNNPQKFRLNRGLDLLMEKQLQIEMYPQLQVDHDYNGGSAGYEKIVTGKYKMRLLVLAPKKTANYTQKIDLEEFDVLTGDEVDTVIENGRLRTTVNLPMLFYEQLYYSYRNVMLIELTPLDVDAELEKGYFVGTFSGKVRNAKVDSLTDSGVQLSTGNIDIAKTLIAKLDDVKNKLPSDTAHTNNYMNFVNKLKTATRTVPVFDDSTLSVKDKTTFTRNYHSAEDLKKQFRLTAPVEDLNQMILEPTKASAKAIQAVCHLLFDSNAEFTQYFQNTTGYGFSSTTEMKTKGYLYKKCKEDPARFIDYKQIDHVQKILKQPTSFHNTSGKLNSNTAYFTSDGENITTGEGERDSKWTQSSIGVNIGGELSKFGLFGSVTASYSAGTRHDVYSYNQFSNTVSTQFRTMNSNGATFEYDRFNLEFKAQVRSCILIASKVFEEDLPEKYLYPRLWKKKPNLKRMSSNKRYYVCAKQAQNKVKEDNFYFVTLDINGTMVDSNLATNTMAFVMRGNSSFDQFRKEQLRADEALVFKGENAQKKAYLQFKEYMQKKERNVDFEETQTVGFSGMLD